MRLENFKKIRPLSLNEILLVLLKKSVWRHFTANLKFCGFGKANFYLKNSPRSHTFHITLYWNRKVYLYPKAYWKILVWTSCMTSFSNFLSNDCFLHIIFWDHKLQSTFCVWYDWEWCYRFFYFIHIVQYKLYCKRDYTHFHKDMDQGYQYQSYFNKRVLLLK